MTCPQRATPTAHRCRSRVGVGTHAGGWHRAKFTIAIVDYSWEALEALMTAAKDVFGEPYPLTASTLVGVTSLWLPELLIEVEAVAVT